MVDGRVIESGPPESIVCSEEVCRSYLGEDFKL
jgi:ABC-type lipopolysaccharide export system ATPase subunit